MIIESDTNTLNTGLITDHSATLGVGCSRQTVEELDKGIPATIIHYKWKYETAKLHKCKVIE